MGRTVAPSSDLTLPEHLRRALATPFGPVLTTRELREALQPDDLVLAVGDVVSMTLRELGRVPQLFICDYKTQRGKDSQLYRNALSTWGDREILVRNPAGMVTRDGWQAVQEALIGQAPVRIVVSGEEDLLGLPCLVEAPDGAVMLYGMPGRGVVFCRVTAELRARAQEIVAQMADPTA